jgi:hypothetical protein
MSKIFYICELDTSSLIVERPVGGAWNSTDFERAILMGIVEAVEEMGGFVGGGLSLRIKEREVREDEGTDYEA